MPRSIEQYEAIRKEKRELILDTALSLFAENGFHQTSIEQIARKAGISKGLTYNYFESKELLLQAVLQKVNDDCKVTTQITYDPNSTIKIRSINCCHRPGTFNDIR